MSVVYVPTGNSPTLKIKLIFAYNWLERPERIHQPPVHHCQRLVQLGLTEKEEILEDKDFTF